MIFLFTIFITFNSIVGYIFLSINLVRCLSLPGLTSIFFIVPTSLFIVSPFLIFINLLVSEDQSNAREMYYILLSGSMVLWAIGAAAAATKFENHLEAKGDLFSKGILRLLLRISVTAFTALAMASAGGMVKATAFHSGKAQYDTKAIDSMLQDAGRTELARLQSITSACLKLEELLLKIKDDKLSLDKESTFWMYEDTNIIYPIGLPANSSFIYQRSPPMRLSPGELHIIKYKDSLGYCRFFVPYDEKKSYERGWIELDVLKNLVKARIVEAKKQTANARDKQPAIRAFALASVYEMLGISGINITPSDKVAEDINFAASCSIIIVGAIVLFYVTRER